MVWRIFGKTAGSVISRRDRSVGEAIIATLLNEIGDRPAPDDPVAATEAFDQALRATERDVLGPGLPELSGRFSRVWFDFVLRHDVIPRAQQVDENVLLCARELVAAFGASSNSTRGIARKLLKYVDAAFQDGRLLASEALLSLFDAEPETRRDNERNLLIERIARQTQDQRTRQISPAQQASFRALVSEHQDEPDEALAQALRWLREHADIDFHLKMANAAEHKGFTAMDESWQILLRRSTRHSFPPLRFRSLDRTRTPAEALRKSFPTISSRPTVLQIVTLCWYLAATGTRHEFDDLLFDAEAWVQDRFGVSLPTLLSEINRAARDPQNSIIDAAERALALRWPASDRELLETQDCERIVAEIPMRLRDLDLNAVPPGAYNIHAFMCDQLLAVPHRRRSRALRLARLL